MKVSVIIPVYNSASYIQKCIESCIIQKEIGEIIVIDDGSTDISPTIISDLKTKDSRVIELKHKGGTSRGAGVSRNLGIERAKFNFISFLDSDDYYLPDRFKKTLNIFKQNPELEGVFETIKIEYNSAKHNRELTQYGVSKDIYPEDSFESIVTNKYGQTQLGGFTYRTEIFSNSLIRCTTHKRGQELNLIWEAARLSKVILKASEPKMVRVLHDNNAILNIKQGDTDRALRSRTWLKKMISYDLSVSSNRWFFRYYINNRPIFREIKPRILRILLKAIYGTYLLLKYPKLFFKLN